jgi:hypothetical protein
MRIRNVCEEKGADLGLGDACALTGHRDFSREWDGDPAVGPHDRRFGELRFSPYRDMDDVSDPQLKFRAR